MRRKTVSEWAGLTEDECRELCRELILSFPFRGPHEHITDPHAWIDAYLDARDAWLDVRLRMRGCPEDQLAIWRERIRHRS
jgi:hypothetical protein